MDIDDLVKDDEFKAKIRGAESLEEVAEVFKSYEIEVTVDELKAMLDQMGNGELDESALESVAGGSILIIDRRRMIKAITSFMGPTGPIWPWWSRFVTPR